METIIYLYGILTGVLVLFALYIIFTKLIPAYIIWAIEEYKAEYPYLFEFLFKR